MKKVSVIVIMTLLIVFVSPLLKIKDSYQEMEYSTVGDKMLENINPFINNLDSTANVANKAIDILNSAFSSIKNGIDYIKRVFTSLYNILPKWLTGKSSDDDKGNIICTEGTDGNWYCQYEDGTPYYGENPSPTPTPCEGLECLI